jgi:putative endonuclease
MIRPSRRGRSERGKTARQSGRRAEWLCAVILMLRGYRILARGHAAKRGTGAGEIDIIARRGTSVIFVEVKARRNLAAAAGAISAHQRRRLERAAGAYLARRPDLAECSARFDAMLVAPWRMPLHLIDAWREGA